MPTTIPEVTEGFDPLAPKADSNPPRKTGEVAETLEARGGLSEEDRELTLFPGTILGWILQQSPTAPERRLPEEE